MNQEKLIPMVISCEEKKVTLILHLFKTRKVWWTKLEWASLVV